MEKRAAATAIEQAASELGVPVDALRLYVAAHGGPNASQASISAAQVGELQEALRVRAGALRLDDLAKTALTIEWLAQAAVSAAAASEQAADALRALEGRVEAAGAQGLDAIQTRLAELERVAGDAASSAIQVAGSVQGMVESQGRDLDAVRAEVVGLRAELAAARAELATLRSESQSVAASHGALTSALREALSGEVANANATSDKPQVAEATISEKRPTAAKSVAQEPDASKSEVPATPAKFGVKREIEFNFLLERMGYRRLDSYGKDERSLDKVQVPTDDEVIAFLAKFELGCDGDEVEMVSVQRGEYQMVQYQRVEKGSGLRGWIGRGRG